MPIEILKSLLAKYDRLTREIDLLISFYKYLNEIYQSRNDGFC